MSTRHAQLYCCHTLHIARENNFCVMIFPFYYSPLDRLFLSWPVLLILCAVLLHVARPSKRVQRHSRVLERGKQCKRLSRDTFMKWQHSYKVEYQSLTWLRGDIGADNQVNNVWCSVCRKFESKLCSLKIFTLTHG